MVLGYRIEYLPDGRFRNTQGRKRRIFLTAVCVLLILLVSAAGSSSGVGSVVRQVLFSGDWEVTGNGLIQMCRELRDGMPLQDALTAFCRQVLEESKLVLH